MRRYQIFDTGLRFSRFWKVFHTRIHTQHKNENGALLWLKNAEQPPSGSLPTPASLSLEIKLHGAVRCRDHLVPVLANVHFWTAMATLPGLPPGA